MKSSDMNQQTLSYLIVDNEIFVLIPISISDSFWAFLIEILNVSDELSFWNQKVVKNTL